MIEIKDEEAAVDLERVRVLKQLLRSGTIIDNRFLEILFDTKKEERPLKK